MKGGEIPPDVANAMNEARRRTTAEEYGKFILNALQSSGMFGRPFNETPIGQAAALRGRPIEEQLAVNENDPAFGFAGTTVGKGIRAFHGSPHSFDKFDLGKIGTGEGAQAYGHGLYFAENEGVARSYRDALTDRIGNTETARGSVDRAFDLQDGNIEKVLESLEGNLRSARRTVERLGAQAPPAAAAHVDLYTQAIEMVKGGYKPGGHMYEVNINASPDEFLDWDKPLSEQTAPVRDALKKLGYDAHPYDMAVRGPDANERFTFNSLAEAEREAGLWRSMDHEAEIIPRDDLIRSGSDVYRDMQSAGGSRMWGTESQKLQDNGISGIKYLDQGSRSAGDGSRNYVVFNPSIIEILRKYGILGPTAAAGALSYGNENQ